MKRGDKQKTVKREMRKDGRRDKRIKGKGKSYKKINKTERKEEGIGRVVGQTDGVKKGGWKVVGFV